MNRPDHGYNDAVASWEDERARTCAKASRDPADECIHGVPLIDRCEDCGWDDDGEVAC